MKEEHSYRRRLYCTARWQHSADTAAAASCQLYEIWFSPLWIWRRRRKTFKPPERDLKNTGVYVADLGGVRTLVSLRETCCEVAKRVPRTEICYASSKYMIINGPGSDNEVCRHICVVDDGGGSGDDDGGGYD